MIVCTTKKLRYDILFFKLVFIYRKFITVVPDIRAAFLQILKYLRQSRTYLQPRKITMKDKN